MRLKCLCEKHESCPIGTWAGQPNWRRESGWSSPPPVSLFSTRRRGEEEKEENKTRHSFSHPLKMGTKIDRIISFDRSSKRRNAGFFIFFPLFSPRWHTPKSAIFFFFKKKTDTKIRRLTFYRSGKVFFFFPFHFFFFTLMGLQSDI